MKTKELLAALAQLDPESEVVVFNRQIFKIGHVFNLETDHAVCLAANHWETSHEELQNAFHESKRLKKLRHAGQKIDDDIRGGVATEESVSLALKGINDHINPFTPERIKSITRQTCGQCSAVLRSGLKENYPTYDWD